MEQIVENIYYLFKMIHYLYECRSWFKKVEIELYTTVVETLLL